MDKHFSISEIIEASDNILNTPSKSSKINNINNFSFTKYFMTHSLVYFNGAF